MPEIIRINSSNRFLVKFFIDTAGKALEKFRYFNSRSLDVLENHAATFVLREQRNIIGYGHLDQEDDIIWLGIAVADGYQGLGLGKLMMDNLFITAKMLEIKSIQLSVDKDNEKAIDMYLKYGFKKLKENETVHFLKIDL